MSKKSKQRSKQKNQPLVKERNTVALNPLLRKSAVHEKSGKAKRTAAKIQLKKTWLERAAAFAAVGQSQVFNATGLCLPLRAVGSV